MRGLGWLRVPAALCAACLLAVSCGSDDAEVRTAPRAEPPAWLHDTLQAWRPLAATWSR